jgi:C-terminal processing protease CtpA/Prc
MKKLILITLLFAAFSGEPAASKSRGPYPTHEELIELIQNVNVERSYLVGTEEELVLTPGQAIRLDFKDNAAGIKDFIFFYNNKYKTVYIYYRYTNDTEKEYQGTRLYLEKQKDYRGTRETSEGPWLWLFYEFEPKDGKAFVKFRTALSLSEKDQEQIKQIEQIRRPKKARSTKYDAIVAKLREKVSRQIPYEFGTVEEVTIVPEKKAVQLTCSDNPDDVEEILIGANSRHIYIYCILSSGSITGGGSRREAPGSFRQVGGSAAIGMWEQKDGKIHVKFQLNDDVSAIIQSYRKLEKAAFPSGRFSLKIQDWRVLFDDTELIFPRLTAEQRVEAFTRLWSTVKFNFANFDLVPELNWDDVLSEYLPKAMRDQSNDAYIFLLQECIARLKDGHTSVGSSWGGGLPSRGPRPPLRIRSVGGKALVTEIVETEEIRASGIKPGDEITHVDGRTVQELLKENIYPYISASTPQGRDLEAYPRILQGLKESRVSLSIRTPKRAVHEVSLTRKASGRALLPRSRPKSVFEYRDIGDGIAYVALNSFGDREIVQAFNEKFTQICRAKGMIIDVRKNGGGSSRHGHAIIALLIDEAIPATRWKTPQYRAAFRAWGRDEQWYDGGSKIINPKTNDPFPGPVVVLIGPETNSAAEDFVVPLHAAGRATIVGQKSRGSTGQPLQFSFLDGKIGGRVCTKRDQYPDGREFVGVGIIPHVEVHPTPADIAAGRDVVLEEGIKVLKSKLM